MEIEDGVNSYPILIRATSIKKYIKKSKLQTSDSIAENLNDFVKKILDDGIRITKASKRKRLVLAHLNLRLNDGEEKPVF